MEKKNKGKRSEFRCPICDEMKPDEDRFSVVRPDGMFVCSPCFGKNYEIATCCGKALATDSFDYDNMKDMGDDFLCEHCSTAKNLRRLINLLLEFENAHSVEDYQRDISLLIDKRLLTSAMVVLELVKER